MNVDEALLVADSISMTALGGKGCLSALLVLATEVRRQHAELQTLQAALNRQAEVTERTIEAMNRNADLGQAAEAEVKRLQVEVSRLHLLTGGCA